MYLLYASTNAEISNCLNKISVYHRPTTDCSLLQDFLLQHITSIWLSLLNPWPLAVSLCTCSLVRKLLCGETLNFRSRLPRAGESLPALSAYTPSLKFENSRHSKNCFNDRQLESHRHLPRRLSRFDSIAAPCRKHEAAQISLTRDVFFFPEHLRSPSPRKVTCCCRSSVIACVLTCVSRYHLVLRPSCSSIGEHDASS